MACTQHLGIEMSPANSARNTGSIHLTHTNNRAHDSSQGANGARDTGSIYLTHITHRWQGPRQASLIDPLRLPDKRVGCDYGQAHRDTRSIYLTHTNNRAHDSSQGA